MARPSRSELFPNSLRTWGALAALVTLLCLLSLSRYFFGRLASGDPLDYGLVFWWLVSWYLALPFMPLMAWLGRRYPIRRERWMREAGRHLGFAAIFSLCLGATFTLVMVVAHTLTLPGYHSAYAAIAGWRPGEPEFQMLRLFKMYFPASIVTDVSLYACVVAFTSAIASQRESRERALRLANLETELVEAQLHALRMQLNPHFLFNTLHTISVMMDENVRAARRMMADLSDLLRLSLDSLRDPFVPLHHEVRFIERYLAIEKERFQSRLVVTYDVAEETRDALVPNLILQPLVENAIKHGIAPFAQGGRIAIQARRRGDTLELSIRDSGPGLNGTHGKIAAFEPPEGGGLGLRNTRQRLQHLFGDQHALRLDTCEGDGFVVTLRMPFYTAILDAIEA